MDAVGRVSTADCETRERAPPGVRLRHHRVRPRAANSEAMTQDTSKQLFERVTIAGLGEENPKSLLCRNTHQLLSLI
jgi:hypothetical protein